MTTNHSSLLVGNPQAESLLLKIATNNRRERHSGTYIINGHDQAQKMAAALWLTKALSCTDQHQWPCQHCASCKQIVSGLSPDLHQIRIPEAKQGIGIEQIKALISQLSYSTFSESSRMVIVEDSETMSESAANALLKTLEEPGSKVIIVLLVDDLDHLPATIVSRSQLINIKSVSSDVIYDYLINYHQSSRGTAKTISNLALGRIGEADRLVQEESYLAQRLLSAESFLTVLGQDVNDRQVYLQSVLAAKAAKGSVLEPMELLTIWQLGLRDLLLYQLGELDLIVHSSLFDYYDKVKHKFSTKRIINGLNLIAQARLYLGSNVNTQLALEQAIINI